MCRHQAQNLLEYALFLAAIVGVLVIAIFGSGGFQGHMQSSYQGMGQAINDTAVQFTSGTLFGR